MQLRTWLHAVEQWDDRMRRRRSLTSVSNSAAYKEQ
jgi:hypothetical protein